VDSWVHLHEEGEATQSVRSSGRVRPPRCEEVWCENQFSPQLAVRLWDSKSLSVVLSSEGFPMKNGVHNTLSSGVSSINF
jgi:hypothetical protein